MKTLNGYPVRIVEFDGKFKIEVELDFPASSCFWGLIKSPATKQWFSISEKGKPTSWRQFSGNYYHWSDGEPLHAFNSLEEAKAKIESLDKGTIIHAL